MGVGVMLAIGFALSMFGVIIAMLVACTKR